MDDVTHTLETKMQNPPDFKFLKKGLVVIDDDKSFCMMIKNFAEKKLNIPCDVYNSLEELVYFARLQEYDLMILDYHLTVLNGEEIAAYVEAFFDDLPVVLISADDNKLENIAHRTRPCIKSLIPKSRGVKQILDTALNIYKRESQLKQLAQ
jgi:CheY-like chemotaxis protein